ncbi:enediyne biosynthesis protein, partial [Streptomyces anulatus]
LFDTAIPPALGMMTGVAFVLFTNYMVTDPGTTPSRPVAQVAFGGGVAVTYGIMTGLGIAYGLFFATAVVCLVRGGYLWLVHLRTEQAGTTSPAPAQAVEARGVPSESGKAPVAA